MSQFRYKQAHIMGTEIDDQMLQMLLHNYDGHYLSEFSLTIKMKVRL